MNGFDLGKTLRTNPTWLFLVFVALLTSCGSSRRSVGVEEGWDLLADRKVNFVRDKDEIPVNGRSRYTAVRFRVEKKEVRINELKIYFRNGDKLEPNIDDVIQPGQYSRVIDLGIEGRDIDRIEFTYRSTGSVLKGRSEVLVFGRRAYAGY